MHLRNSLDEGCQKLLLQFLSPASLHLEFIRSSKQELAGCLKTFLNLQIDFFYLKVKARLKNFFPTVTCFLI